MTSAPIEGPHSTACACCGTLIMRTEPDAVYPKGLWLSTTSQGMGHRSKCPSRCLLLGYAQPHVPQQS